MVQNSTLAKQPLRYKYPKITAIDRPPGALRARDTLVRGTPHVKSMHLGDLLKWRPREVAAVYDVDRDDPRASEVQAQIEVQITEVTRSARVLVTTNAPYPEHDEVGALVRRWKYFRHCDVESVNTEELPYDFNAASSRRLPPQTATPGRTEGESSSCNLCIFLSRN